MIRAVHVFYPNLYDVLKIKETNLNFIQIDNIQFYRENEGSLITVIELMNNFRF